MRLIVKFTALLGSIFLSACVNKGSNPADPYEPINREIHKFNMAFDATMLRPPARLYKAAVPPPIRSGINNAYNNVNMLPTIANDLLQAEWKYAIKDTWRFLINSTFGIAGVFDVAAGPFGLPPRSNDLGLTFAKWGDKQSPYVVIPFLGPSTIRDGFGMMFDFTLFTPYPYIPSDAVVYSLIGLRYIDLRSQMLETDPLIAEAIDSYTFIRDAYLQRRNFLITGEQEQSLGSLYVDAEGEDDSLTTETPADGTPSEFPITTAEHATHRTPST
ncbi:MlaA family lipoprotein [Legionella yabuuchiae]|uniref:MlaA family lipoprotein n=1 Tax=Legionella yabuuchiae TaxID=376727 RepID=UPI0010547A6A|nr:VacJ family lipoprotein [Legionella yabuuchiae]